MNPLPSALIWVDPGKMTGYALLADGVNFSSGQLNFEQLVDVAEMWCRKLHPSLWLGWEQYIVTGGGGRASPEYSLEAIGVLKSACHRHGVTVLRPMPSASRKLGDDDKLKRLGWYTPGKRHANDAANHLLAFLLRESLLPGQQAVRLFTSD